MDIPMLRQETSKFLGEEVLAVGVFHPIRGFGSKKKKNQCADGKIFQEEKKYHDGDQVQEQELQDTTQKQQQQQQQQQQHSHLVCAVTDETIYLLDWNWNPRRGEGPTRSFVYYNRDTATIRQNGIIHHTIDIREGNSFARFRCNLALHHSTKTMNHEVVDLLKESSFPS
mmetsp:Transcript_13344/g.28272  ORF Transcript_13344/g.28272 Transcript_13344/m.28272 type:complete len:170 (+) Transcript_13344:127-636(+)